VSLMTSKNKSRSSVAAAAQRARDTATQVVTNNAVPMAKNVGLTARQGAEDAVAWATPRVRDARAWAAPQVEQAGLAVREKIAPAISEKIAPAISDAIIEAAHWLDNPPPRRRLWPRVLGGIAMLAAAGSAIAAAVLRRRPTGMEFGTEGSDTAQGSADQGTTAHGATDDMMTGQGASPADEKEPKSNGRVSST